MSSLWESNPNSQRGGSKLIIHLHHGNIKYLFRCPDTLVVRVVNHGRFPFTIHLIIPVLGLSRIGVRNMFRLVPIFGFLVIGVRDGGPLIPIFWFLGFGVL